MINEFWRRQARSLEDDRKLDRFWAPQDFRYKHLGHTIEEITGAFNSGEVDPTTGDQEPIFGTQVTCHTCNDVKSTVR